MRHSDERCNLRNKQKDHKSYIRLMRKFGLYPFSDRKLMKGFNQDLSVKIHHSGVSVDDRFKDVRSGEREKNED